MRKSLSRFLLSCVLPILPFLANTASAATCEELTSLKLPQTSIAQVQSLRAGSHPQPVGELKLPICRIVALVGPKAIKLEIWLPTEGWNGKFQGVGNGGLAGTIAYPAIRAAIARGYAAAATDTGHTCTTTACDPVEGTDLSWFTNEQRIVDYAYRAIHEMTVKAKEVIRAFYGEGPRLSYFNGCSTGGGQALININRFPQDYDGVVAGAPSFNRTRNLVGQVWIWHAANTGPAPSLPQSSLALINKSVLAKCDARDGVADGIMEDPRRCDWQPAEILCRAGQDPATCLTEPQVRTVERIYSAPRTSDTGEQITPPQAIRGSELNGWATLVLGPLPRGTATNFLRYMFYQKPDWDPRAFGFTRAEVAAIDGKRIELTRETFAQAQTATSPDIGAFTKRGGKVLMYHGWGDSDVAPLATTDYYERATRFFSGKGEDIRKSVRLFMVPGMGHCRGGAGATDTFDALTALEDWVEKDRPPERIIASHLVQGVVKKTRPLCVYPQVAKWTGNGSVDDAANFVCTEAK